MNKKQRIVVMLATFAIVTMLLVPHWKVDRQSNLPGRVYRSYSASAGYSLLFLPPELDAFIDASRLAVQCLVVLVLAGGLYLVFKEKR